MFSPGILCETRWAPVSQHHQGQQSPTLVPTRAGHERYWRNVVVIHMKYRKGIFRFVGMTEPVLPVLWKLSLRTWCGGETAMHYEGKAASQYNQAPKRNRREKKVISGGRVGPLNGLFLATGTSLVERLLSNDGVQMTLLKTASSPSADV